MTRTGLYILAICTLFSALAAPVPAAAGDGDIGQDFDRYVWGQISMGAIQMPVAAQLQYRAAIEARDSGDLDGAVAHLERALALDPDLADAYFTLAQIRLRRVDPTGAYDLYCGLRAAWTDFSTRSLLAVNAVAMFALIMVALMAIASAAFAIRYLPFVAHKLSERLRTRTRASLATATAYLVILTPFVIVTNVAWGFCALVLMTWYFMHRRERATVIALMLPFLALGLLTGYVERLSPLTDPRSLTSMLTRAAHAPGDVTLIRDIGNAEVAGLEGERYNSLGLLYQRLEENETAAGNFRRAVAARPGDAMAYINLGNAYYQDGQFDKALEGYRKAHHADSSDAIGQYNLAQAYIKTLLMAESSKALQSASAAGIEAEKERFAEPVRSRLQVFPRLLTGGDLWRAAGIEGRVHPTGAIGHLVAPYLGYEPRTVAWMMLISLALALIMSRVFKRRHLAFQCSNCGQIMCESCGNADRGSFVCPDCAGATRDVSSEKVVEALLRQRRQKVVVRRRKSVRMWTASLPGLRDIFYGNVWRGLWMATLFSASLLFLGTRGLLIENWNSLEYPTALWKWILPGVGITIAYAMSLRSKHYKEIRNYRDPASRRRQGDGAEESYRAGAA